MTVAVKSIIYFHIQVLTPIKHRRGGKTEQTAEQKGTKA